MIKKDAITSSELAWRYKDAPEDRQAKVLLLTDGRVAIVGPWLSGDGIVAWCPLPKRDKDVENEMGLI